MALTLTATRKDKPILGFFKDTPSARMVETARRISREPVSEKAPVFRTTRSELAKSVSA